MLISLMVLYLSTGLLQSGEVIGNPESRLYHRADLPHVRLIEEPIVFASREEAEAAGYRPCPVCYYRYPPALRAIQDELVLAGQLDSQVRFHYRLWQNAEATDRVQQAIERVLQRWPVPLKGYRYQASLLDVDLPNAIAVPAGQIYVTRGLYETVETEAELEAVLALQVAHIEGRHGLRSFENSQGFGAVSRILTGLATSPAGIDLSKVINYAKKVVLTGYSRTYTERARRMMIATLLTSEQQAGARRIFQKLADLYAGMGRARSPFATLPTGEEDLRRLQMVTVRSLQVSLGTEILRSSGLTARLMISRIACDGTDCQLYAWLAISQPGASDPGTPRLYVLNPTRDSRRPMEIVLKNRTGAELSWTLTFNEIRLGASTLLGVRPAAGAPEIDPFLAAGIESVTLHFLFSTAPDGNPIGDALEFRAVYDPDRQPEGRLR